VRSKVRPYDERRFSELMLYVASRMADESSFGATMLNKVLCFSDFLHYARYGDSITGAEYMRLPYGPAPRPLKRVQNDLIGSGQAACQEQTVGAYVQKRLVPLRDPDLSLFSGTEIAMVDQIITQLRGRSAVSVSDLSHGMLGWQVAPEHETIPYESIFLYAGPVTESDEKKAREIADDLREQLDAAGIPAPAA
jgi:Protein of unknown function (DUF4065)